MNMNPTNHDIHNQSMHRVNKTLTSSKSITKTRIHQYDMSLIIIMHKKPISKNHNISPKPTYMLTAIIRRTYKPETRVPAINQYPNKSILPADDAP